MVSLFYVVFPLPLPSPAFESLSHRRQFVPPELVFPALQPLINDGFPLVLPIWRFLGCSGLAMPERCSIFPSTGFFFFL